MLSHNPFDVQSLLNEFSGSLKEITKIISIYASVFCSYVILVEVRVCWITDSNSDEHEG